MNEKCMALSHQAEELFKKINSGSYEPYLDNALNDLNISFSEIDHKPLKLFEDEKALPEVTELRYTHYQKKRISKLKDLVKHIHKLISSCSQSDPTNNSISDYDTEISPSRGTRSPTNLSAILEIHEQRHKNIFLNQQRRKEATKRASKLAVDLQNEIFEKQQRKAEKIKILENNHAEMVKKRQIMIKEKNMLKMEKAKENLEKVRGKGMTLRKERVSLSPTNEACSRTMSFVNKLRPVLDNEVPYREIKEKLRFFDEKMDRAKQRYIKYTQEKAERGQRRSITVMKIRENLKNREKSLEEDLNSTLLRLNLSLERGKKHRDDILEKAKQKFTFEKLKKQKIEEELKKLKEPDQSNLSEKELNLQKRMEARKAKLLAKLELHKEKNKLLFDDAAEKRKKQEKMEEEKYQEILEKQKKELEALIFRKKLLENFDKKAHEFDKKTYELSKIFDLAAHVTPEIPVINDII
ncbi:unnamed protein product [Blepharisma stoltei]|uniref:Uncharacterized protein n=1 Tax=Blepharisma stoltei TaxID=1481888 RepID=A0AAU9IUM8_9CILI|nr:unnamed protein product [Blepharisma stoltei]